MDLEKEIEELKRRIKLLEEFSELKKRVEELEKKQTWIQTIYIPCPYPSPQPQPYNPPYYDPWRWGTTSITTGGETTT